MFVSVLLLAHYFVNSSLLTYRFRMQEPFKAHLVLCMPSDSKLKKQKKKSMFCTHSVFTCFE